MNSPLSGASRLTILAEVVLDLHAAMTGEVLEVVAGHSSLASGFLQTIAERAPLSIASVVCDLVEAVAKSCKDKELLWRVRVSRTDPRTPHDVADLLRELSEEVELKPLIDPLVGQALELLAERRVLGIENLDRITKLCEAIRESDPSDVSVADGFVGVGDTWFSVVELGLLAKSYGQDDPEWGERAVQEVLAEKKD